MEYNWYNQELKEKLKEYIAIREHVDPRDLAKLNESINTIRNLLNNHSRKKSSIESDILEDYTYLSKYPFLWPIAREISEYTTDEALLPPKNNLSIKEEEIIGLVHDFFKNCGSRHFFLLFLKIIKGRKNIRFIRRPNRSCSNCLFLNYDKSFYIQIQREYSFNDISNLAHEIGHIIQFLTNYNINIFHQNEPYSEIVSVFFELICYHHYSQDTSLYFSAILCHFQHWDSLCEDAKSLSSELQIIDTIKINENKSKIKLKENIRKFINANDCFYFKEIIAERPVQNFIYIIAQSIAVELFKIYLNNPDFAFYLLQKIMEINPNLPPREYLEQIKNLGIIPNSSISEYDLHLKRELKRVL